jgi:hypothetical protein
LTTSWSCSLDTKIEQFIDDLMGDMNGITKEAGGY